MSFQLYPDQQEFRGGIEGAWALGFRNVLGVLPTGGGKTVVFSSVMRDFQGVSVAIAHRMEILGQISMALAKNGVLHQIIGPDKSARMFAKQQREEIGRSWVRPRAMVAVASVDTLMSRAASLRAWGATVGLWVQDEAHHVLGDNKWGKVTLLFPNARGLGMTATPKRGDRRSLAAGSGGVFHTLVPGRPLRWLIDNGRLSDYRIFAPTSDIDISNVRITQSGDFNRQQLAQAARVSHIVGDIVGSYLQFAPGEQGATFVTDIQTAKDTAGAFRLAGVPAAALSAKSKPDERFDAMRAFKNGEILQLINVDLFGEGFDLPSLGVVSFARHTASWGLFAQQFGRVLRKFRGKTHGKIIDHVGNVARHKLPDRAISWDLHDGEPPRQDEKEPPLRMCTNPDCLQIWEGYSRTCPHCKFTPEILARSLPEHVEGDLTELSPDVLAAMRGAVDRIDSPSSPAAETLKRAGAPEAAVRGAEAQHRKRRTAQQELRERLAAWGGYARAAGLSESERHIKFYREFGVDVISAQALGRPGAESLAGKVEESIEQF